MAAEPKTLKLVAALVFGLAGPVHAADPQGYTVEITGAGSSQVDAALRASSQLVTLQGAGPLQPFALVARARSDLPRLATALDSFGYYQNSVSITVEGLALDNAELPARLDAIPAGRSAAIKIVVTPGSVYHFGKITLEGETPEAVRAALGISSGDVALAASALDAKARLLSAVEEDGFALARVDGPDATANDKALTIDLTYKVHTGPRVAIGEIRLNGLKNVNEDFVRRALTIHSGDLYQPSKIESARQTLAGLGVFSGVSVSKADHPSSDGRIPLIFELQEGPHHAVTLSGTYSTDLGILLSATWSHRNLFGNAEQLNLTAAGTGLGTSNTGLGYNLVAQYIQPYFIEPDQVLELNASGIKQQLEAYDQTAETIAGFVRRKFSHLWSGSAGLALTHDQVVQQGTNTLYELLSVPLIVSYDSTGITGALHDPVNGLRAALTMTPNHAFGGSDTSFLLTQLTASSYFDLAGDGRSVIATRGLAATILGASNFSLPPDQRLYAGGSGTVRGYAFQSLGPQFADGKPQGAKSVDAATIELRQRIGQDWGAAVFVDAGQASTGALFTGKLYAGAGTGVRYYTAIGAVRADVAVPLVHLPGGDSFEVYIGLGQAF
jgi:translocation and assembly module TamA